MDSLHDPKVRDRLRARLVALTPAAQRKWGRMSADQMLWHCADALEAAVGRKPSALAKSPMPRALLRFFVLNAPWPKGAPTLKELVAAKSYDFEAERARCIALLDEFAARDLRGPWPAHGTLGAMSGEQYSRLHAKHLNHHLTQFGA